MREASETEERREETTAAGERLHGYLLDNGGQVFAADVRTAGDKAGHSYGALHRARKRAVNPKISSRRQVGVFPAGTIWEMDVATAAGSPLGAP